MQVLTRRVAVARAFVLAAALGGVMLPAEAAPATGRFNVSVTLNAPVRTAFCRTSEGDAFGAVVTVVCSTGEVVDIHSNEQGGSASPRHGGANRYVLQRPGELPYAIDSFTDLGTIATWRVVRSSDRVYLEMLVGW